MNYININNLKLLKAEYGLNNNFLDVTNIINNVTSTILVIRLLKLRLLFLWLLLRLF